MLQKMRQHLHGGFVDGFISCFPIESQRRFYRIAPFQVVDIMCHCRMPLDGNEPVIACCKKDCSIKNFHESCVQDRITQSEFICSNCLFGQAIEVIPLLATFNLVFKLKNYD